MGNRLPKHQETSERIKMCPIKESVQLKTFDQQDLPIQHSYPWIETCIIIHQSSINLSSSNATYSVPIDENFIMISQVQSTLEVYFLLVSQKMIFIFKFSALRQFKDVVLALFNSKRPSWILSPICQMCCRTFSVVNRDHHCRYCGKNICKGCSVFGSLEISGFQGKQRLCCYCLKKVKSLIVTVKDIQINSLNIHNNEGLYFLRGCESVLSESLKG